MRGKLFPALLLSDFQVLLITMIPFVIHYFIVKNGRWHTSFLDCLKIAEIRKIIWNFNMDLICLSISLRRSISRRHICVDFAYLATTAADVETSGDIFYTTESCFLPHSLTIDLIVCRMDNEKMPYNLLDKYQRNKTQQRFFLTRNCYNRPVSEGNIVANHVIASLQVEKRLA